MGPKGSFFRGSRDGWISIDETIEFMQNEMAVTRVHVRNMKLV